MSTITANYRIVGTGAIEFGTAGAGYTAIGVIVSASRKDSGEKLELKDRYGNVYVVIYFNERNECEIQAIFDTTSTLPVRGDGIDVCGLTGVLVDDIEKKWEHGKEVGVTIKAVKYPKVVA